MNRLALFIISVMAFFCGSVCSAEVVCTTHTYAVKDGKELKLDVYVDDALHKNDKCPVFIYSFGGGWEKGSRKDAKWITRIAQEGYVAVCIDYRLGIKEYKDQKKSIDGIAFGEAYSYAISLGVEDLYDATSFIVNNADKWNADPKKIIVSGGSAGATNSIMAEYYRCNESIMAKQHLPKKFKYAGVVAFAGGIWKPGLDEPIWKNKPCPFIIMHGTKDQLVPYKEARLEDANFSGFGPGHYISQFIEMKVPYAFYTCEEADHVISAAPDMTEFSKVDYTYNIIGLMNRLILKGENVSVNVIERYNDTPYTFKWLLGSMLKHKIGLK